MTHRKLAHVICELDLCVLQFDLVSKHMRPNSIDAQCTHKLTKRRPSYKAHKIQIKIGTSFSTFQYSDFQSTHLSHMGRVHGDAESFKASLCLHSPRYATNSHEQRLTSYCRSINNPLVLPPSTSSYLQYNDKRNFSPSVQLFTHQQ